jgi:hypothetical protein
VLLSGDVHYAYVAQATYPDARVQSKIYQAVCSPFRHPLSPALKLANRVAFGRVAEWLGKLLARSSRVPPPPLWWRRKRGPYFANEVARLELLGRGAQLRLERASERKPRLECVVQVPLTPDDAQVRGIPRQVLTDA